MTWHTISSFSIANYSVKDKKKLEAFFPLAFQAKGEKWFGGSPLWKNKLAKPHYKLEEDLFVAEQNRKIVGLADVTPEIRLGRIVIDWFVHPAFPRRNLGRELLKYAFRRGRELGAEWAHICVPEEDKFSRDFLEELDFRRVRCFVDLELNLTKDLTIAGPYHLDELSHFRPGDEALLATTQNKIFSGSWGFCPNSPEEIRYFFLLTNSKWPDILFLKETSNIVGYFWPHPVQKPGHSVQKNRWRIHMFGINPEYQGKGWGKKVFATGLNDLKRKGAVLTEISVDSENTPALALYRSFGFKLKARDFWYEKLI